MDPCKLVLGSLPLTTIHTAYFKRHMIFLGGFRGGSDGKGSACNAGDQGSIPGLGRSPGEGRGYPCQYSCRQNSMDKGVWQAAAHGVTKSWTRLNNQHFHCYDFPYHSMGMLILLLHNKLLQISELKNNAQHIRIISQFQWSRSTDSGQLGPLLRMSQSYSQGIRQVWSLI